MKITSVKNFSPFLLAGAASAVLVACGFGDGGSGVVEAGKTNVPVSINGIAATGLALPNANVSIQCALPRTPGTTTTDANGRYSFTFPATVESAGPCIVSITPQPTAANPNPTPLTSITKSAVGGTALVANVTPLTTAVVNALIADARAANPTASVASAADLVDPAKNSVPQNVGAAMTKIVAAIRSTLPAELQSLLPANADLLADPTFKPATATTAATDTSISSVDKLLDVLAGKSVTVVTNGVPTTVAGLPPAQQLINPTTGVISATVVTTIANSITPADLGGFSATISQPAQVTVTGASGI